MNPQYLSKKNLKRLQLKLVKETIKIASKAKLYRQKYKGFNFKIRNSKDFQQLPLMDKIDLYLSKNDPMDFMACSKRKLATLFTSGGTTGRPKLFPTTFEYLERNEELTVGVQCEMMKVGSGSTVALLLPFGVAQSGSVWLGGLRKKGAFVLPFGLDSPWNFVFETMKIFQATHIFTSPSVGITITKEAKKQGYSPKKDFKIKGILTVGAPLTKTIRNFLNQEWSTETFDFMGASEVGGMACECHRHDGLHVFPDFFYMEVLDSDTYKPVPEGKVGELVVTNFKNEGYPLLRFRLDDLVRYTTKKCACGRTSPRIWILGRASHTIYLATHKFYGYQIEAVLDSTSYCSTDYQLTITEQNGKTLFDFKIEVLDKKYLKNLYKSQVEDKLKNMSQESASCVERGMLKIRATLVLPGSLPRTPRGKIKDQIIDLRKEI